MVTTLGEAEELFGFRYISALDRDAEIPVIDTAGIQGDVTLLRVTTSPATTPIPAEGILVVRGEAGGNTHSLHGNGFWDTDRRGVLPPGLYYGTLTVPEGGTVLLSHCQHGGLLVSEGTWEVGGQRQWLGEWQRVAD